MRRLATGPSVIFCPTTLHKASLKRLSMPCPLSTYILLALLFSISRTETSDDLGQVRIYYYDPVIEGMNGSSPIVKTYNTGSVEFGVFVK